MNDIDRDLRDLFERKAGTVGGVAPKLPGPVQKRGRRRQLGTMFLSGVAVVAVVVASVAGLRAIDAGPDRTPVPVEDPWAGYEIFERTATVGSFTITSDSDWFLVRPPTGGVCASPGCPVLQLTNFDPGLDRSACGSTPPADGVAMVVIPTSGSHRDGSFPPWPNASESVERDGPCGPGRYFRFTQEGGFAPHIAWIGQGAEASDRDVPQVLRSFHGMRFEPADMVFGLSSAYVIAGGENAAGPWRLEVRPSANAGPNANIDVHLVSAEGAGVGAGDFMVPGERAIEQAGGDPVFGAVTKEASGVELQLEAGTPPIPAQILPLPPSLPFEFDLFLASNPSDVPAVAVALGLGGSQLEPPPTPTPDDRLADLMTVHDRLETALHRLWAELAAIDELEGEVQAAQGDLGTLTAEIGADGPTKEQTQQVAAVHDLIARFVRSMGDRLAVADALRTRIHALRGARAELVDTVAPALLPSTATVTCTGDSEGGTSASVPAILAQEDGVHIDVVNALRGERVFLDVGTGDDPIEVASGARAEIVLDGPLPQTLEIVCTFAPPRSWPRPSHPLTVIDERT